MVYLSSHGLHLKMCSFAQLQILIVIIYWLYNEMSQTSPKYKLIPHYKESNNENKNGRLSRKEA